MFSAVRHLLLDLFTERDGTTWDYMKVIGTAGIFWWVVIQSWDVIKGGHNFDPQSTAIGFGGLLAAVGGGIAMRSLSHDTTATPAPVSHNDEKTNN